MDANQLAYFLNACRQGNTEDISKICSLLPEAINARDEKGFSPLIIAAYNNQLEAVKILIANGADPELGDAAGNTALMGASFKGYEEIVRVLLDSGADPNTRNGQGATALTFAATFGQARIASALLDKGARTDIPDSRGKTPIDHARIQENEVILDLLLSAK